MADRMESQIAVTALELPGTDVPVSEQVDSHLEGATVRRELQQLPAAQREALQLAYFQGYTQQEIAAITGAPLGTVKTRMHAGVRTLRKRLLPAIPSSGTGLA